jgi:heme/copper-type cytochrome/quinol oxidase subunit 2
MCACHATIYASPVRRRRLLVPALAGAILFAAGLSLASCGGGEQAQPTTDTSETTTTTTTTTETTQTTTQPEGPTVVRIRVVNGAPKGGIVRETVQQGDRVVLVVTSDVTDHIHLHSYNIMRDVAPGRVARLPFRATVPGRFEVELEDRGVPIADITVQP